MKRVGWMLLMMIAGAAAGFAQQEPVRPEEQVEEADPRDVRRPADERAASVNERILRGDRNQFGCFLGAYQAYSSNLFNSLELKQGGGITALFPSIFANYARGKSRFHADYSYGYRFYNNGKRDNADQHRLNLDYSVPLSKRVNLTLYDRLDDSPNDGGSLFNPSAPGDFVPGYAYTGEYLRAWQKVFRNDSAARLGFQVSRGGTLSLAGGYQVYKYDLQPNYDMSGAYGSASYTHRITKWLSISSSYTAHFTDTNSHHQNYQIQRVEVGNFEFSLSRTWKAHVAGGVDYSSGGYYGYGSRTTANLNAGISHSSRASTIALAYRRGMSTVFGQPGLYKTDTGVFSYVRRLNWRTSLQVNGNYQRGSDFNSSGKYEYYWATTSLQFGLRHDLVASANYSYINQKSSGLGSEYWDLGRYVVYVGVTYFWPVRQN
jgi:hypothetical protein